MPAGSEVVLTRDLKASRERVFAAWIDVAAIEVARRS